MTFDPAFDLQGVMGRGIAYRTDITVERVPKWSQTTASLPEYLTQPGPFT